MTKMLQPKKSPPPKRGAGPSAVPKAATGAGPKMAQERKVKTGKKGNC